MPSISQVIGIIIGFVVVAITTPIAMNYLFAINGSFNVTGVAATYSAVYIMFTVLFPVLYIVGVAIHFVPKGKG
jgi:hypothetical protein